MRVGSDMASTSKGRAQLGWAADELAVWREELLAATGEAAALILGGNSESPGFGEALAALGRGARVSRAYIFVLHGEDPAFPMVSQQYEWCAAGIKSEQDNPDLKNFPLVESGFGRWLEELRADRPLFGPVREMPAPERAVFEPQGILSYAVLPILRQRELWGFIGFDDCVRELPWTNDTIECLRVAARVLGALANWLEDFSAEEFDIRPDLDQIPALAAERDQQWKRVSEASFLTAAEKRALLGLPAQEVGDAG